MYMFSDLIERDFSKLKPKYVLIANEHPLAHGAERKSWLSVPLFGRPIRTKQAFAFSSHWLLLLPPVMMMLVNLPRSQASRLVKRKPFVLSKKA